MERMKEVPLEPPVTTFANCTLEEMSQRFESFYPAYEKKLKKAAAKSAPKTPVTEPPKAPEAPAQKSLFERIFKK